MTTKTPDADVLDTAEGRAQAKLERLISEQGVTPVTIEELRAMRDLWPEDEKVDEFSQALRQWRSEESKRTLP